MPFNERNFKLKTIVGVVVVVGFVFALYAGLKAAGVSLVSRDTYTLYASFTSVSGIVVDSPVDVFGIEAGWVSRIRIDNRRRMAVVTIKIRKGINVYSDGTATIKTTGLIGDRYISVDPGGAGSLLKNGGMITNTTVVPGIDQLAEQYFSSAK